MRRDGVVSLVSYCLRWPWLDVLVQRRLDGIKTCYQPNVESASGQGQVGPAPKKSSPRRATLDSYLRYLRSYPTTSTIQLNIYINAARARGSRDERIKGILLARLPCACGLSYLVLWTFKRRRPSAAAAIGGSRSEKLRALAHSNLALA
jgi:hypothetical protein